MVRIQYAAATFDGDTEMLDSEVGSQEFAVKRAVSALSTAEMSTEESKRTPCSCLPLLE